MIFTEEHKKGALAFYKEALELLAESEANFMVGGAFAVFKYSGIFRDTKDLDIFCKSNEYPKILKYFSGKGFRTELTDVRWLAKVFKDDFYIDIIFDSSNSICKIDDSWFQFAVKTEVEGINTLLIPPEELIWSKIYIQNRERYDGADINHIILKYGKQLDWKRLLYRLDQHWHILLAQLIIFQFVYPADYHGIIPKWLFDELIGRANEQYELPESKEKVCRGPLIDQTQYAIDIKEWNYKASTIMTT
jgi:hypothetical protein